MNPILTWISLTINGIILLLSVPVDIRFTLISAALIWGIFRGYYMIDNTRFFVQRLGVPVTKHFQTIFIFTGFQFILFLIFKTHQQL